VIPALLHAIALAIALSVQYIASPLAGTWLFFHLAGCAVLLIDGYPKRDILWYCSLAWLLAIGDSAFILAPVITASPYMWVLAAAPMMALCLHPKHLKPYIISFGTVIGLFSAGLVVQWLLQVHYTATHVESGYAWPLLDPNNAAAVINCALIPAFALGMKKPKYLFLAGFFALALALTQSKAGVAMGILGCTLVSGMPFLILNVIGFSLVLSTPFWDWQAGYNHLLHSFADRFPIWEASAKLLFVAPWTGLGIGSFSFYYAQVRTETFTAGSFAHNDLLQFAIELGFPLAMAFVVLMFAVLLTTRKHNLVSFAVMLAVFMQAMIEFQFYIPSISLLMGLALAYQRKPA